MFTRVISLLQPPIYFPAMGYDRDKDASSCVIHLVDYSISPDPYSKGSPSASEFDRTRNAWICFNLSKFINDSPLEFFRKMIKILFG